MLKKIFVFFMIILLSSCFNFKKFSGTDNGKDTPKKWGYGYKKADYFTDDCVHISAWEILQDKKNPWIIIVPGFEDNKSDDKVRITVKKLAPYGYNFMLMDPRGFGNSGGIPSFGIIEKYDILGAVKQIRKKYKARIGVVGFSQGSSASILAASVSKDIDALVLWAPYSDFEKEIYYFLKWRFAGSKNNIIRWARKNPVKVKNLYENLYDVKLAENKPEIEIKKIKYEIILGHGINDSLIPFSNAVSLINAKKNIRFIKSTGDHSFYGININERNLFLGEAAGYLAAMLR
jgi:pimeloyl-ACP methyl ester carboxylesterase